MKRGRVIGNTLHTVVLSQMSLRLKSVPEEGGAGLAGDALADEGLAGSGGTEQEQALGRSADPREDIWPQHRQHDDLPNLQHRHGNG